MLSFWASRVSTVSTDFPKLALSLAEGDDQVGSDDGDMTTTFMEIHIPENMSSMYKSWTQSSEFSHVSGNGCSV